MAASRLLLGLNKAFSEEFVPSDNDSDVEDHEIDERKHAKILETVGSLDGKRKILQRSEPSLSVSEYDLSHAETEKSRVHQLLSVIKQTPSHHDRKHKIRRLNRKAKVLPAPLPKPQQEKIQRSILYEKVQDEVSKWDSVVQKNRQAEQLQFPLLQPDFRMKPAEKFVEKFKPKTPMEIEIQNMLSSSENVITKDTELTPAEEKALHALSLEEAQERIYELRKMRALLSFKELKARRQNKIKSKKYHRILKKERLKKEMKEFEELRKVNPELAAEKLKEVEKRRIVERMTLRHKNTGKWAKQRMLLAKYDKDARLELIQQLELSRKLTEKSAVESSDDDDTPTKEDSSSGEIRNFFDSELLSMSNPWIKKSVPSQKEIDTASTVTKFAKDAHREQIDRAREETGDLNSLDSKEVTERKEYYNVNEILDQFDPKEAESEENISETEDSNKAQDCIEQKKQLKSIMKRSLKEGSKKTKKLKFNSEAADAVRESFITHEKKRRLESVVKKSSEQKSGFSQENVEVDPSKFMVLNSAVLKSKAPNLGEAGEEVLDDEEDENQAMTIAEAFADDDVIDEFREEKKATVEQDTPKGVSTFLPGWGSWAGSGIKVSEKKKNRFFIKPPPAPPRKDSALGNVIINEKESERALSHQVKDLPFPFNNPEQFETVISHPLGNTWNPETSFRDLTAPKVITKLGTVIEPIDAESAILNKKTELKTPKDNFKIPPRKGNK